MCGSSAAQSASSWDQPASVCSPGHGSLLATVLRLLQGCAPPQPPAPCAPEPPSCFLHSASPGCSPPAPRPPQRAWEAATTLARSVSKPVTPQNAVPGLCRASCPCLCHRWGEISWELGAATRCQPSPCLLWVPQELGGHQLRRRPQADGGKGKGLCWGAGPQDRAGGSWPGRGQPQVPPRRQPHVVLFQPHSKGRPPPGASLHLLAWWHLQDVT